MKINPTAAYQYYKSAALSTQGEASQAKKEVPGKTDTVSFSGDIGQRGEFARLTQNIAAQIETSVPKARLQALQSAIEGNGYHIPTDRLADSMMNLLG